MPRETKMEFVSVYTPFGCLSGPIEVPADLSVVQKTDMIVDLERVVEDTLREWLATEGHDAP